DFTHFYKGKLDDVRVYGCVLNNSQVDSLYNLPAGGSPCQITASASTVSPSCFQGSNGSIDLSLSGGTSPYTYMWSNGSTTQDLSTITAGNYTVVIHDATGCDAMLTVNVPHPTSMSLNVSTTSPTCGMDNGSASVAVSNGVMPYTYNWSNGDNISVADSMTAGTYMITAYDANGCSAAHTFMLSSSGAPTVSSVVTNATCAGSNNGAIDLTVTGGTPPFSFVWSNSSTTEDLAGIKPGSYMVQITDAAGCITGAGIIVGVSSIQVGTPVISQPACGASDGSIAMNPTGASPFTYLWSANAASATTSSVSGLPSGIYSVTISDNNNCSVTQNISLSNPNAPVTQLVSVMPANCSGMLGAINMNVTSGTPPFTYSWSNGATTQDISNLLQGTYHLSVTGGNGCMSHSSATVPGIFPDPITLCMSTVDSASGKVLCVWEKPNLFNIDRFNIYRENAVAGQYDFWFTKPFDSLSQWTDQSANPVIRGWRYKVTMVDTCGNESSFGTNHKTLHLVSSRGLSGEVNLIWDTYEGFNYPTVYINRYHASTGWELIDSVPSTLHAYVDVTAPASGLLRYTVDVRPPTSCEATRAINHNSTRSNRGTIAPPAAVDELLQSSFRVFPNPTDGVVSIVGSDPSAFIQNVMIYDLSGKRIHRMNIRSSATSISIENLERGIYILEVHTPTGIARYRIVRS
ncbi:MAG TPA: T9SS type A sorting domain-containing protein, partial [Flavobacteriales bacterium]|nr:T9SS type A sorting domain-containing protein [Flavobacteriales bacterium]